MRFQAVKLGVLCKLLTGILYKLPLPEVWTHRFLLLLLYWQPDLLQESMDKKICSDRVMWDSPENISNSVINSVCFGPLDIWKRFLSVWYMYQGGGHVYLYLHVPVGVMGCQIASFLPIFLLLRICWFSRISTCTVSIQLQASQDQVLTKKGIFL